MSVETINKKRKKIVILSIILNLLVFLIFLILGFLFFFTYWYYVLISIVIIILLLYLESKFLIMPLYDSLIIQLMHLTFQNRYPNYDIEKSKDKNHLFGYFFNEDKAVISNHILFDDKKVSWDMFDFTINKSKKDKDPTLYGKYVKISKKNICNDSFAFFSQNKLLTEQFKEYFSNKYSKGNDSITTLKKNKSYFCYYNQDYDYDFINCFEELDDFNSVIMEKDKIEFIMLTKEDGFHFRLQDKLNQDVIFYIKDKYALTFKIIDKILQVAKGKEEHHVQKNS